VLHITLTDVIYSFFNIPKSMARCDTESEWLKIGIELLPKVVR